MVAPGIHVPAREIHAQVREKHEEARENHEEVRESHVDVCEVATGCREFDGDVEGCVPCVGGRVD
jgi:hypothetical protein